MALKPHLPLRRIIEMNLGFLGLQFSFGLQQANMTPIWNYLHQPQKNLAWLGIAGPLTGLIVQPIIGSMSDRTASRWGRRTPYFLFGAVMCCFGLFFMPLSATVLMAFSLLFLLDIGNNVTMEPYRAYVNDRLNPDQRGIGFLSQSAFTGLAQTLAYLTPSILVWFHVSNMASGLGNEIPVTVRNTFWIGALLSIGTILWSILRVRELPLEVAELARIKALPKSASATLREVWDAIRDMPHAMRTMAWMSLFQWYAMVGYWGYVANSVSSTVYGTTDGATQSYKDAMLFYGKVGAFYNFVAFLAATSMPRLSRKYGASRMHMICLAASGCAMLTMPFIHDRALMFLPAIGIGLGWGSIMGNPYIILANAIPAERTGVYMGIFNMMICAPMLIFAGTMTFAFEPLLGGDPRHVLLLSGALMFCAALTMIWVKEKNDAHVAIATG